MHAFCMQIIKEKDSVKGLGMNYRLKKYMLTNCWCIYSTLYYYSKMLLSYRRKKGTFSK